MLKKLAKIFICSVLSAVLLFSFVACADTGDDGDVDDTYTTQTFVHAHGETVITKKPERVITLAFGNQDIVLALGVVPVGFSFANFGVTEEDNGMLPWTKAKLAELGENNPNVFNDLAGIDFEAVANAEPDIILAPYSSMTKDEYDTLSLIAPVIPHVNAWAIEWAEWVRVTARALRIIDKGEELIDSTNALVAEEAAKHPHVTGKKVIWANFRANLNSVGTYTPSDTRGTFLKAMGMDYPQSYYDIFVDTSKYSLSISSENAHIFNDADVIIGYATDAVWASVKEHAVWGQTNPIKNNAIAAIGSSGPLAAAGTATPLSIAWTIGDIFDLIGDAIGNA